MRLLRAILAAATLVLSGCQSTQPLVDSEFEGVSQYTFGRLRVRALSGSEPERYQSPRLAMFWNPAGLAGDPHEVVEQPRTSRPLPTEIETWTLFAPPNESAWADGPGGGRYALGRLLAYDDLDGDKARGPDEPLIGDSLAGILYVPEALDAARSPFGRPLPAGMHRVEFPVHCGAGPAPAGGCGELPLGAECRQPEDCEEPTECMQGKGRIWAHGVCGLRYDPSDPCVPANAGAFFARDSDAIYFLQSCERDTDCRSDMNEYCDQGVGACFTGADDAIWLGSPGPDTLCHDTTLPPNE